MGCKSFKGRLGPLNRGDAGGPDEPLPSGRKGKALNNLNGVAFRGFGVGAPAHNNGKAGGNGILAFRPDDETAKAYHKYVMEVRRVAVAQGILPAVTDDAILALDATGDKGGTPAGTKGTTDPAFHRSTNGDSTNAGGQHVSPPARTLTVYQFQPLAGDTCIAKGMYSEVHLAHLSVFTGLSEEAVNATLPRYAPARRGNTGSAATCAAGRDCSSFRFGGDVNSAKSLNSGRDIIDATSAHAAKAIVGPASAPAATPTVAPTCTAVSHYIIAMKELFLRKSYTSSCVLEQVCLEVRRWARLSTYCPRLLRCYQLEYVFAEGISMAVPEASYQFFPGRENHGGNGGAAAGGLSASGNLATGSAGRAEDHRKPLSRSGTHLLASLLHRYSNSSPKLQQQNAVGGTPRKLRLYLEYAKHGTLRGFQVKEMPSLFERSRLHELTARAYMRDVLLALLQMHDRGEMQYDLCAKAVFLHRPIQSVYYTYFPAYISDLPTGDLTSVTPSQLGKALGLLNPPPVSLDLQRPPPLTSASTSQKRKDCENGPINGTPLPLLKHRRGVPREQRKNESSSVQRTGKAAGVEARPTHVSMLAHKASCTPQVSAMNANPNESHKTLGGQGAVAAQACEQGSGNTGTVESGNAVEVAHGNNASFTSAEEVGSLDSPLQAASLTETGFCGGLVASGSPSMTHASAGTHTLGKQNRANSVRAFGVSEASGDDGTHQLRLHETYRRFMSEFEFTHTDEGDGVPFPSPHDGVRGQADAEMLASTMVSEEALEVPPMRVVPLQNTSLGGIAILSPDHYVVKPVGTPLHDLRGRLPILLTPSTSRAAFFCRGPQHQRQATHKTPSSPAPTVVGSPSTEQFCVPQTLSSGTSAFDAVGSLGRCRGGAPLVKLNHTSMIRCALSLADCRRLEDVPVHKYVTVTHAAPEVLHRRLFSTASDIYAFAMTFVELVSEGGVIMEECLPENLPKPLRRRDKDVYDARLSENLNKWYQARITALLQNHDAASKEKERPDSASPQAGPIAVRLPPQLSDECKKMLRWCLQPDPAKRPTAAELLRSRYFMLGDWIAAPSVAEAEGKAAQMPEAPWMASISFDAAAKAAGLPVLSAKR